MKRLGKMALAVCLIFSVATAGCMKALVRSSDPSVTLEAVMIRFNDGIQALNQGKSEKAVSVFESLIAGYPDVSVFHHNLGVAYRKTGATEKAIKAYRYAAMLNRRYPESHYNLAIILRGQGKFGDAEKEYKTALDIYPEFKDAHYNLAVLYDLYLDKPAEAIRHYQDYVALGGTDQELIGIWIAGVRKRIENPEGAE